MPQQSARHLSPFIHCDEGHRLTHPCRPHSFPNPSTQNTVFRKRPKNRSPPGDQRVFSWPINSGECLPPCSGPAALTRPSIEPRPVLSLVRVCRVEISQYLLKLWRPSLRMAVLLQPRETNVSFLKGRLLRGSSALFRGTQALCRATSFVFACLHQMMHQQRCTNQTYSHNDPV